MNFAGGAYVPARDFGVLAHVGAERGAREL